MALMFTKIYINIVTDAQAFREKTYGGVSELVVDRHAPRHVSVESHESYHEYPKGNQRVSIQYEDRYTSYDEQEESQYDNAA